MITVLNVTCHNSGKHSCYRPQRSCEGYVFTRVCLSTEGSTWAGAPPGTRYTPHDQVHPHSTRYTPQDQVHPSPWDQVHLPLEPGTPPGTRYTSPQNQVHPPGPGTPPGTRYTPRETATVADGTHPTGMHSCFLFIFGWRSFDAFQFLKESRFRD